MMKLSKTIQYSICGGVSLIALAGASPAQAVSYLNTYRPNTTSPTRVGEVDSATGIFNTVNTNGLQLTDIALNTSDQLFGTTFDQLYKINGALAPTIVGNLGVTGMNGLAFDNLNNLYGIGSGGFYGINSSTGKASIINALSGFTSAGDIVFDPIGNRFFATSQAANAATSSLYSISLTGVSTLIGNIGVSNVYGLTMEGNTLFGYRSNRRQVKINSSTGAVLATLNLSGAGLTEVVNGLTTNLIIGGATSSILPKAQGPISAVPTSVPEPSFAPGFVVLGACLGARAWIKHKKNLTEIES
jgi:hypothetical protein